MCNNLSINQLRELNEAFAGFCAREYEQQAAEITSESEIIAIAYTTSEVEELDVEVQYDLINNCYLNCYDGEVVSTQPMSIDALIEDFNYASFDEMVSDALYYAYEIEDKEN